MSTINEIFQQVEVLLKQDKIHQATLLLFDLYSHPDGNQFDWFGFYKNTLSHWEGSLNMLRIMTVYGLVLLQTPSENALHFTEYLLERHENMKSHVLECSLILRSLQMIHRVFLHQVSLYERFQMNEIVDVINAHPLPELSLFGSLLEAYFEQEFQAYELAFSHFNRALASFGPAAVPVRIELRDDLVRSMLVAGIKAPQITFLGDLLVDYNVQALCHSEEDFDYLLRNIVDGNIEAIKNMPEQQLFNKELLLEKVRLAALLKLIIQTMGEKRPIMIEEIQKELGLSLFDTHAIIVKAIANNLITGCIDQIEGVVHVTGTKSRPMSMHEMGNMLTALKRIRTNIDHGEAQLRESATNELNKLAY